MQHLTRRSLVLGGLGIAGAGALGACSGSQPSTTAKAFGTPTPLATTPGQRVTTANLVAKQTTLDLGGPKVATWTYGDTALGLFLSFSFQINPFFHCYTLHYVLQAVCRIYRGSPLLPN